MIGQGCRTQRAVGMWLVKEKMEFERILLQWQKENTAAAQISVNTADSMSTLAFGVAR